VHQNYHSRLFYNIDFVYEHAPRWQVPQDLYHLLKTMTNDWKERVRPILQLFVDRLPGALLEEKDMRFE